MWTVIGIFSAVSIYGMYKVGILQWIGNVIAESWDDIIDIISDIDFGDIDFD